jgi:hypothetical protein
MVERSLDPRLVVDEGRLMAGRRPTWRLDQDDLGAQLGQEGSGEEAPFVGEVEYPMGREHASGLRDR